MKNYQQAVIATLFCSLLSATCICQEVSVVPSLLESDSFFQRQSTEMQLWLDGNLPKAPYKVSTITTEPQRVSLTLMPQKGTSCAQARTAWQRAMIKQPDLSASILKRFSFLSEIEVQQARLEVKCCAKAHFHQVYTHTPKLPDSQVARSVAPVPMIAPLAMIGDVIQNPKATDETELSALIPNAKATDVARKVRTFCASKYGSLPKARYIWDAELKFTEISDTEFNLEVTYITNVVISDGYFEYHKIYVTTQQSGANAVLNVRLLAKYGSGIIFAPRRNDYKDMETAYKTDLTDFRSVFFRQIMNVASK
jgi:hypothetical protein